MKEGICSACKEHSGTYELEESDEPLLSDCCGAVLICEGSGYDEDLYER